MKHTASTWAYEHVGGREARASLTAYAGSTWGSNTGDASAPKAQGKRRGSALARLFSLVSLPTLFLCVRNDLRTFLELPMSTWLWDRVPASSHNAHRLHASFKAALRCTRVSMR